MAVPAAAELLPLVYDELRNLAAARLAHKQAGHILQPTALVHEAYARLVGGGRVGRPRAPFHDRHRQPTGQQLLHVQEEGEVRVKWECGDRVNSDIAHSIESIKSLVESLGVIQVKRIAEVFRK